MGTLRLGWRGGPEEEGRGNHEDRQGASAPRLQKSSKAIPRSLDFYDRGNEESLDDFSHKSDIIGHPFLKPHSLLKWEGPNLKEWQVGLNVSGRRGIQLIIKTENRQGTQWERRGS